MGQFVEMDIFFFITTVVVIAIGVLLFAILLRIWRILGHVEEISRDVSEESALVRGDIAELRQRIKTEGLKVTHLRKFLGAVVKRAVGAVKNVRKARVRDRDSEQGA